MVSKFSGNYYSSQESTLSGQWQLCFSKVTLGDEEMKLHLESQSEGNFTLICVILSPLQDVIICRCGENEGIAATYNIDLAMLKSPTQKTTYMIIPFTRS